MADATIIHAPSSTKNAKQEREPQMHQTKKGNQWYFGMQIHIGADVDSGAVHSLSVTAANRADISELPPLLRPDDQVVFGDAGYASDDYKRGAHAPGMTWRVQGKAKPKGSVEAGLSGRQKKRSRRNSGIRARVEHVFRIVKRQFGYTKTRYRGLAKNAAQVMTLIGWRTCMPCAAGWRRHDTRTVSAVPKRPADAAKCRSNPMIEPDHWPPAVKNAAAAKNKRHNADRSAVP